jgi:hypothetical protein
MVSLAMLRYCLPYNFKNDDPSHPPSRKLAGFDFLLQLGYLCKREPYFRKETQETLWILAFLQDCFAWVRKVSKLTRLVI